MNAFYYIAIAAILLFNRANAANIPKPPDWLSKISENPPWWTNVIEGYNAQSTISARWAKIDEDEAQIKILIKGGKLVTDERCRLIKFMTFFAGSSDVSSNDSVGLKSEIASIYGQMGDHRRAIKIYVELLQENPAAPLRLQAMAMEYERLGERRSAIEIYDYMEREFKDNKDFQFYAKIAETGSNCLIGTVSQCVFEKPDWWEQFQQRPEWWTNVQEAFPPVTSFKDGLTFMTSNQANETDSKRLIKGWSYLSEFTPITFNEKTIALMSLARAYSTAGDHHRSIESAWRIPEQFSGDIDASIHALKLIISEFETLGETNRAEKIRVLLPCFSETVRK